MAYLQHEKIPFILRLRENQHVLRAGYAAMPISVIAQHLKVGDKMIVKGSCWLGRDNKTLSASVRLVMRRLASGELLALACSGRARHALARYRQRWTIETMFGNLKTKGFALEATHLTRPEQTVHVALALGLHTFRKIFVAASPDQIIAFLAQLLSSKLPVKPLLSLHFR